MVHILGGKNNMKTATKISLIATISTLALAGTAFAAWEFNKSANLAAQSNVAITKDASEGTLEIDPATFYLTLDQDVLAFTESDHTDDANAVSDQITTFTVTYTGSDKANDVSDVTLAVTYNVDAAIASYVTVSGGSLATPTASANVKTAVYTLPTLAWSAKPTTQAAFNSMKTALASAKISFTISATVA